MCSLPGFYAPGVVIRLTRDVDARRSTLWDPGAGLPFANRKATWARQSDLAEDQDTEWRAGEDETKSRQVIVMPINLR